MAAFLKVLFSALVIASAKTIAETDGARNAVSNNINHFFDRYQRIVRKPVACAGTVPCYNKTCTELCYGPPFEDVLFAVCYNEDTKIPVFSAEILDPNAGCSATTKFIQDKSGFLANQASFEDYNKDAQFKYRIFGKWTCNKYFLARGHLTPSADLGDNSKFTFIMTNVAPQWQPFNNGNWRALETALRDFVARSGRKLLVVTGTAGDSGFHVENGVVVPRIFWKAVCDVDLKESVIFYSVNPVDITNPNYALSGCNGVLQKVERGVIKCEAIEYIRSRTHWGIPDFYGCKPKEMQLGTLITNLTAKIKHVV